MAIKSKPFFWLECDGSECGALFPDHDGVIAYADESHVVEMAPESDWLIAGDKHFCEDHAFGRYCRECGSELTELEQDMGDHTCFKCEPIEVPQ